MLNVAKINVLEIKISEEEAIDSAKLKCKSIFYRILLRAKKIEEVRLHYIEFKLVTVQIYNKRQDKEDTIKILVNGSTGGGSIIQDIPKDLSNKEIDDDIVQYSDKDNARIRSKAMNMAMRISHKFMGGTPEIKIKNIESIFRPYWVVFFDKVQQNKRVIYIPIEADGFKISRN